MTSDRFDRRNYRTWPETTRAEVLPVAGLLSRNADIDLCRAELVWAPRRNA
ncbi:MAG TPA: hypothetical protein VMA55_02725 [Acidovorax sp.]|nr:hypothetical protein [Acidovorax sp.]